MVLPAKRACDSCKRRKTKCDDAHPRCSNCRAANLECTYRVVPKKRGPRSCRAQTEPVLEVAEQVTPSSSWHASELTATSELSLSESTLWQEYVEVNFAEADIGFSRIRGRLKASVTAILPGLDLTDTAFTCIQLYMQFLFPISPIVHEPTLRQNASSAFSPDVSYSSGAAGARLARWRAFALSTALCAEVATFLPETLFAQGNQLAFPCLEASRETLRLYHDADIEQPDSTSIAIRYFHCNCLHAIGKTRVSWYLLGECIRLAHDMKLHDETSLHGLGVVEAQLRRNLFWQLYTGDKSAAILNNRPVTLHESAFRSSMSLAYADPAASTLLDPQIDSHGALERTLLEGFNLTQRLWSLGAMLLLNDKIVKGSGKLTIEEQDLLADNYVQFLSVLDEMPHRTQGSHIPNDSRDPGEVFTRRTLSIQRANLLVTYHALRMIILQKYAECGLLALIGLCETPLMLALRKSEIAHDLLQVLQEVPFESLQLNGEPCVEKIRLIGASLLQITQSVPNSQVTTRVKRDFYSLLDILARLDSKASEALCLDATISPRTPVFSEI